MRHPLSNALNFALYCIWSIRSWAVKCNVEQSFLQTKNRKTAEHPGISDVTLKGPGNPQGPEHLRIARKLEADTQQIATATATKKKSNKHKEIIAPLTNPSRSFTPNHTQKRHPYSHSRSTCMHAHTIPMVTNNPPILHPSPLWPPCQGVHWDKEMLTSLFFFLFPSSVSKHRALSCLPRMTLPM